MSSYLDRLIAEGENEHQDFKYRITDSKKIARSISAFANNSGGHLLIGVKDNGTVAGMNSDEEMYMVDQAAQMYCKPSQPVTYEALRENGKTVLKANVEEATVKPVKAPDEHGAWKAYYRVADENILASSLHVKVMSLATQKQEGTLLEYSEHERMLLDYLQGHGGISLNGYARLAHISSAAAQTSIMRLCEFKILAIAYHNGDCVITLA